MFLTQVNTLISEDTTHYKLSFLKSINSENELTKNSSVLNSISDFLFGKEIVELVKPNNIIALDSNNLIIFDKATSSIFRVNNSSFEEIKNDNLFFPSISCSCYADDGCIYFTDSKLNKIFIIKDNSIKEFQINDSLNQPSGIVYSKVKKQIIVSETSSHNLKVFDLKGNFISKIGSRGKDSLQFNFPTYLWIDKDSKLYINDALNYRIQILDSNYKPLLIFGEQGDASGYFAAAKGIATDSFNHIYIIDAIFNNIQVFNQKGEFLYNLGTKGKKSSEFYLPSGIFIDKFNRIYIADTFNSRIQIFNLEIANK